MSVAVPWAVLSDGALDFASVDSAMGHAADFAYGLALAQPERPGHRPQRRWQHPHVPGYPCHHRPASGVELRARDHRKRHVRSDRKPAGPRSRRRRLPRPWLGELGWKKSTRYAVRRNLTTASHCISRSKVQLCSCGRSPPRRGTGSQTGSPDPGARRAPAEDAGSASALGLEDFLAVTLRVDLELIPVLGDRSAGDFETLLPEDIGNFLIAERVRLVLFRHHFGNALFDTAR